MGSKGQAIVEFALVFPLLCFVALGFTEAAFLFIDRAAQDRATDDVVEWAAGHQGQAWNSIANRELPGCDVTVTLIAKDLLEARSACAYIPRVTRGLWPGLVITSAESAVLTPGPTPTTSGSPQPSPSP